MLKRAKNNSSSSFQKKKEKEKIENEKEKIPKKQFLHIKKVSRKSEEDTKTLKVQSHCNKLPLVSCSSNF